VIDASDKNATRRDVGGKRNRQTAKSPLISSTIIIGGSSNPGRPASEGSCAVAAITYGAAADGEAAARAPVASGATV